MSKYKKWCDMTDDELRTAFEQARREEATRQGKDAESHVKSGWAAMRRSAILREQEPRNDIQRENGL